MEEDSRPLPKGGTGYHSQGNYMDEPKHSPIVTYNRQYSKHSEGKDPPCVQGGYREATVGEYESLTLKTPRPEGHSPVTGWGFVGGSLRATHGADYLLLRGKAGAAAARPGGVGVIELKTATNQVPRPFQNRAFQKPRRLLIADYFEIVQEH